MIEIRVCFVLMAVFITATAAIASERLVLQNKLVHRVLEKDNDVWRTVSFSRADGSEELKVQSDEILIRLMDGTALTLADYRASSAPVRKTVSGTAMIRITYVPRRALPPDAPQSLVIEYSLRPREPYLRKTATLMMQEGGAVDRLEVERFRTGLPCERGGRGEPVFIGKAWFVGLEYPGSETAQKDGLVTLAHYPGLVCIKEEKTSQWIIRSKTAVMGAGLKGDPLELAFSDYLDTIRRPRRNMLHYNSWYDWRGDELVLTDLTATFAAFKKNLLDPYGLKMNAFVPDDGWQDYRSIWEPRKNLYPEGFVPLHRFLESQGSRLGLWMPLNGTNLDTDWGASQGYEKSNQGVFYCLASPRYNAAIREATRKLISQGHLIYYKHDFNHLRCTAGGHGHLPDERHGHEANLDAELELLAYQRKLQPDIFLNITSFVWYSPWWLMHADSIWMDAGDFGYDRSWPQLSRREQSMSYRDQHLYGKYRISRHLVPVSDLMTHGIIHGRYQTDGEETETLREWSDYAVMYFGRGVQLKELYITPDMITPDQWEVLGKATRWAVKNRPVLQNSVLIGGDPRKGEVNGYASWQGDKGIVVLRNADIYEQAIEVPFDKSVRYRGKTGRPFRGRVIYPFIENLSAQFVSGEPLRITVPGASVLVMELRPGKAGQEIQATLAPLPRAYAEAIDDPSGIARLRVSLQVPDETMQRCDLMVIFRFPLSSAEGSPRPDVLLNGQPAKTRRAEGDGWAIESIDLRSLRGQEAEIIASLPAGTGPFSTSEITASVWLVSDRPVKAGPAPERDLPFPIAQNFRRQSVRLLPETGIFKSIPQGRITGEGRMTLRKYANAARLFR